MSLALTPISVRPSIVETLPKKFAEKQKSIDFAKMLYSNPKIALSEMPEDRDFYVYRKVLEEMDKSERLEALELITQWVVNTLPFQSLRCMGDDKNVMARWCTKKGSVEIKDFDLHVRHLLHNVEETCLLVKDLEIVSDKCKNPRTYVYHKMFLALSVINEKFSEEGKEVRPINHPTLSPIFDRMFALSTHGHFCKHS